MHISERDQHFSMAPIAYTRFPSLLASEITPGRIEFAPKDVIKVEGSETEVLQAWANILKSYTGHDDKVVFLVDGGFVTVSFDNDSVKKELGEDGKNDQTPQDATGVFTSRVSIHDKRNSLILIFRSTLSKRIRLLLSFIWTQARMNADCARTVTSRNLTYLRFCTYSMPRCKMPVAGSNHEDRSIPYQ